MARVHTATSIMRKLEIRDKDVYHRGKPSAAKVHSVADIASFAFYVDSADDDWKSVSFNIADEVARLCNIKSELHLRLLYLALSHQDIREVKAIFEMEGLHVQIEVTGTS
jgi:hypothetical protein